MSNPAYTSFPSETQISDPLVELALNLRWSWSHKADEIWSRLDPALWELTRNPWLVLQTVSQTKLAEVMSEAAFRQKIDEIRRQGIEDERGPAWFQTAYPDAPLKLVAYFSMEYMLSEALPIYSGGLGNVAGDQLKAASDLGVPVVGVGLLYQQGYFRQVFDHCSQRALYPFNDPGQLPIQPLRDAGGEWLRLQVVLPGHMLYIRTWIVRVGRTRLYLLDTNDPANPPEFRCVTNELYGGGSELRMRQEEVLGIGGWRLLRMLKLNPDICHLNEGHAAFAALERARAFMHDHRQPFEVALAATRAGNIFTTHTAVDAGFDRFSPELIQKDFKFYAEERLEIPLQQLLALGRRNPDDSGELFNMAYLALRSSGAVNGVSRLHAQVSQRLFQPLFSRWPEREVPVSHVTNGVHVPTWESPAADALWNHACGAARRPRDAAEVSCEFRKVSDTRLWQFRVESLHRLIAYTRQRLYRQRAVEGASSEEIAAARYILDPNLLTIGFARRFATYKRPNLLLHNPDRLLRILNNRDQPVQLILAGKAHPQDIAAQQMVREWNEFARRPDARERVVFLSDADMLLTQQLVQGVDLWINTPRRPWEACGTSGMKVLANGGLNFSELDGWWAEAYAPEVGWSIGDGQDHGDDPAWDAAEADRLYDLLENEVVPLFYTRDEHGISTGWVTKMRESMARLTPQFSADRTVRDYTERYVAAAACYRIRSAQGGEAAVELVDWKRQIEEHWSRLRFGRVQVATHDNLYHFEIQIWLDDLDPDSVRVELIADPGPGLPAMREVMARVSRLEGGGYSYTGRVPANRPVGDYTPRAVPYKDGVSVPLEAAEISWQR